MKYKLNNKILSKNRFSFDFDGTLSDDFDGTFNSIKKEIQDICKCLVDHGKDVYIVTKRYLKDESDVVYELSKLLNVSYNNIIFTNRELKAETLIRLNIDCHFENDEYEIQYLQKFENKIQSVLITDSYWRDIVY